MWLQLGNQDFRQVLMTGVVRRLVVRPPNWESGPRMGSWEDAYVKCTWRSEDHTLLDFLRLSNKDGHQRKNSRRVCASAVMGSRLRDEFYGKWLLLNVPFRSYLELWDDKASRVPEGYQMLTLCFLKRPGFLRPSKVREDMQLEGYRDVHIDNVLAMLEGNRAVIEGYLSGEWNLQDHPVPPPVAVANPVQGPQEERELDVEQQAVLNAIKDMVMWELERRYPEDLTAEELERLMKRPLQQAPRQMRPLCVLGPAGSGKSTAVQVAIRRASQAGAHVGIACPTGVLASSYREQFADLDVDTLHGMFLLHLPPNQAYDTMSSFDFVVIDEVGQLSQETFERLMWLWDNAERRPALVFVGDFHHNGRRSPALWAPLMGITDQWKEEPSSVGASHGHHGPMEGGAQLCGRLSWTSRTNGRRSPALWAPLMDITDQWKEELCGRLSWTSRTNGRRSPALWAPLMDITDQWTEEPALWAPLMDITDQWKEEPSSVGASHGHHGPMEGGAQLCGRLSWTSRTNGRRSPALWAPLMDITDQWKEEPSSVGASHGHHGPMEGGAQLCGRLSWTSRTNGRRSPALWAPLMDITDQWKEEPSSVGASHGHHGPMEGGAQLCGRLSWTSRTNGRRSPALWAPLMDITDQWKEEPSSVGASHGHHGPIEGGRLSWTSRTNGRRSPALWAPLMDITDQWKEEPSSVGASHGHHGPMEGGAQLCGRLSWTSRTNGRRSPALWAPLMDITDQWKEEPSSVGASHGHHGPMEGGAQLCGRLSWTSRTN